MPSEEQAASLGGILDSVNFYQSSEHDGQSSAAAIEVIDELSPAKDVVDVVIEPQVDLTTAAEGDRQQKEEAAAIEAFVMGEIWGALAIHTE